MGELDQCVVVSHRRGAEQGADLLRRLLEVGGEGREPAAEDFGVQRGEFAAPRGLPCSRLLTTVTGWPRLSKKLLTPTRTGRGTAAT